MISNRPRRRAVRLLAVVLAGLVLAACGGGGGAASDATGEPGAADASAPAVAAAAEGGRRTVTQETGEVEIPADPQTIVALDEYAAMNLLALGVRPDEVFGFFEDLTLDAILEEEGLTVTPTNEPNLEAIAAFEPDLIVFTREDETIALYEEFSGIAPTLVVPFQESWEEVLGFVGAALGREERAEEVIAALDERCAEVRDQRPGEPTLSILGFTGDIFYTPAVEVPMSRVVEECGFTRPEPQTSGEQSGNVYLLSPEVLAGHDADTIAVLGGPAYEADVVRDIPTYQSLSAVQRGRAVEVNGGLWFTNDPFGAFWIMEDLRILDTDEQLPQRVGPAEEALERWEAFNGLIG